MPFAYYDNLTRAQQAIYRKSDRTTEIPLADSDGLAALATELEDALGREDRVAVGRVARQLCQGLCKDQGVAGVKVRVLARRPASASEELHGLYEQWEDETPRITVWMRTARKKQVVAFRTLLRTLLHELCHHLDYNLLELADSFHTEGFFKRESSLFSQLVPERKKQGQLTLF